MPGPPRLPPQAAGWPPPLLDVHRLLRAVRAAAGPEGGSVTRPDGIYVHITGHDIYETVFMPAVPRKGDILWLSSLTRGANPIPEVIVSKVEWSMEQQSGIVTVWLTVRRHKVATPTEEPTP
jgi:hypothetical protein